MILADLPPNSKVTGFKLNLCEFLIMIYPTSVEPVNEILSTNLCWERLAPVYPKPDIILTTPGGNPASLNNLPKSKAVKGVCYAGLRTIVHPAANAGATFQHIIKRG